MRVTDTGSEQGALPVRGGCLARGCPVSSGALVLSSAKHGHAGLESTIELRLIPAEDEETGLKCHKKAAAPEPRSVSHPKYSMGAVRPHAATGPRLLPLLDDEYANRLL